MLAALYCISQDKEDSIDFHLIHLLYRLLDPTLNPRICLEAIAIAFYRYELITPILSPSAHKRILLGVVSIIVFITSLRLLLHVCHLSVFQSDNPSKLSLCIKHHSWYQPLHLALASENREDSKILLRIPRCSSTMYDPFSWRTQNETTINQSTYNPIIFYSMTNRLKTNETHMTNKLNKSNKVKMTIHPHENFQGKDTNNTFDCKYFKHCSTLRHMVVTTWTFRTSSTAKGTTLMVRLRKLQKTKWPRETMPSSLKTKTTK